MADGQYNADIYIIKKGKLDIHKLLKLEKHLFYFIIIFIIIIIILPFYVVLIMYWNLL